MHTSYQEIRKHPADFRVKYRFYSKKEGGRQSIVPYQGYRSDFWYEHADSSTNQIFMINPEFEDENGEVILYNDRSVPKEGTALMWILFPEMRPYHQERIAIGTKGYFMEGGRRVAECIVIEILSLATNPTE